jgi:hypothetical protein
MSIIFPLIFSKQAQFIEDNAVETNEYGTFSENSGMTLEYKRKKDPTPQKTTVQTNKT